ncbi:FAD-dependent oxidoreductase [Desulfogranum marinum]|uniref:FAD-dependent oxidoreductase n=1 Tax=Desulfogranum marinum TaxID=453220 RepID=UPI0019644EC3|nr:FAD-dependent oxidoreductase [Desulfogranum marinum]MBM9512986.1 FAD-dependent oxidoreductase [Desulfogranum marinum]
MATITREPRLATQTHYDLIIIGGGIYGVALAYTASQMGLTNLVIEKKDFGWSTTYNHLRTVHGGLRYLQTLDLHRFKESVAERHWFLKEFPGLVRPLPCLMPLYGNGPYRPSVFKMALLANDFLSRKRNESVAPGQELNNGQVISPEQVVNFFPQVDREGLKGGAVWYDGGMPFSQLLIMEMLQRACANKTTALNYMEAEDIVASKQKVCGVKCRDQETGAFLEFKSPRIVNATGPWCRDLAAKFHDDDPDLFKYSIAWNVLFDRPALSDHSLAIKPKRPNSSMYFVHGFNGRLMGGTIHSPWDKVCDNPQPSLQDVAAYIDDLNLTVPGLKLKQKDVLQIYSGLLPAQEQGTAKLANRPIIKDHGASGGPQGIYTVSGVKFTTARLVAEQALRTIFPHFKKDAAQPDFASSIQSPAEPDGLFSYDWYPEAGDEQWQERLSRIICNQSVHHLEDLILRRTTLGDNPHRALDIAPRITALFPWDAERKKQELENMTTYFQSRNTKSYGS